MKKSTNLLIYILLITVSRQQNQFLYYDEMYYEGMMTPLREIINKWLLGNGNRTTNSLSIYPAERRDFHST